MDTAIPEISDVAKLISKQTCDYLRLDNKLGDNTDTKPTACFHANISDSTVDVQVFLDACPTMSKCHHPDSGCNNDSIGFVARLVIRHCVQHGITTYDTICQMSVTHPTYLCALEQEFASLYHSFDRY